MRKFPTLLFLLLLLTSCKKDLIVSPKTQKITSHITLVEKENSYSVTAYIQPTVEINKVQNLRAVVLNSSLLGYFTSLQLENKIIAISEPDYIYQPAILKGIKNGTTQMVGKNNILDTEKLLALKPYILFTNYISSQEKTYNNLRAAGIPIIFIDEFTENHPLERSKILILIGTLFNKKQEAEKLYSSIEKHYNSIKNRNLQNAKAKKILVNEAYENIWYIPTEKTAAGSLLADANSIYSPPHPATNALSTRHNLEEMLTFSADATVWLNAGNYQNLQELLYKHPEYQSFKPVLTQQVYTQNKRLSASGKGNDYFERGNVFADSLLLDFSAAIHPELYPQYRFVFIQRLADK